MGNVMIFPKENRNSPSNVTIFEKIKESIPSAYTFRKILKLLFVLIRFPIFLVMYFEVPSGFHLRSYINPNAFLLALLFIRLPG